MARKRLEQPQPHELLPLAKGIAMTSDKSFKGHGDYWARIQEASETLIRRGASRELLLQQPDLLEAIPFQVACRILCNSGSNIHHSKETVGFHTMRTLKKSDKECIRFVSSDGQLAAVLPYTKPDEFRQDVGVVAFLGIEVTDLSVEPPYIAAHNIVDLQGGYLLPDDPEFSDIPCTEAFAKARDEFISHRLSQYAEHIRDYVLRRMTECMGDSSKPKKVKTEFEQAIQQGIAAAMQKAAKEQKEAGAK